MVIRTCWWFWPITVSISPSPICLFSSTTLGLSHQYRPHCWSALSGLDCHQVTATCFPLFAETYRVLHHSSGQPRCKGRLFQGWAWHPVPASSQLRSALDWGSQTWPITLCVTVRGQLPADRTGWPSNTAAILVGIYPSAFNTPICYLLCLSAADVPSIFSNVVVDRGAVC